MWFIQGTSLVVNIFQNLPPCWRLRMCWDEDRTGMGERRAQAEGTPCPKHEMYPLICLGHFRLYSCGSRRRHNVKRDC